MVRGAHPTSQPSVLSTQHSVLLLLPEHPGQRQLVLGFPASEADTVALGKRALLLGDIAAFTGVATAVEELLALDVRRVDVGVAGVAQAEPRHAALGKAHYGAPGILAQQ